MPARSVKKQIHHPYKRESYTNKKPLVWMQHYKRRDFFFLPSIVNFVWVALINYTSKRNLLA